MSNGEVCCLTGVCCPPAVRRQRVVEALARDTGWTIAEAETAFDWFDTRADFAPKGFQPTIDAIAAEARAHPHEE